jgi:hypothetical protein
MIGCSEPTPIAAGLAAGSRPLSGRLRAPSPDSRVAALRGGETSSKVLINPLFRADSVSPSYTSPSRTRH